MKYIKLAWHIFVITVAMYIIRPIEAFLKSCYAACVAFKYRFIDLWDKQGWSSLELYKQAWERFKGDE